MSEDTRRILAMVAEGRIGVEEGERLIAALAAQGAEAAEEPAPGARPVPKFLKIDAQSPGKGTGESVRVRIPLGLIRAGLKMRGLVPEAARGRINASLREKGLDLDLFEMSEGDIDRFVRVLGEVELEADGGNGDKVSIRLE